LKNGAATDTRERGKRLVPDGKNGMKMRMEDRGVREIGDARFFRGSLQRVETNSIRLWDAICNRNEENLGRGFANFWGKTTSTWRERARPCQACHFISTSKMDCMG